MMIVVFIVLAVIALFYGILLWDTYSLIKLAKKSLEASEKWQKIAKEVLNDSKEIRNVMCEFNYNDTEVNNG